MSDGWASPVVEWLGGIIMLAMNVIIYGHRRRMENLETHQQNDHDDLASFKLDSEKRFAKEETLQMSLARIHDRLDVILEKVVNGNHRQTGV